MIDYRDEPTDQDLHKIAELAQQQLRLEKDIQDAQERLERLQRQLRIIQENELPDAMLAAGVQSYTLANGASISIKDGVSASLGEGRRDAACAWLREHGFGDIVSETVTVAFGRGQDADAQNFVTHLTQELNLQPSVKTDVNTATLKALIREQLKQGVEMPLDVLGAYVWRKSIIKTTP